jgi:hypothetical protein
MHRCGIAASLRHRGVVAASRRRRGVAALLRRRGVIAALRRCCVNLTDHKVRVAAASNRPLKTGLVAGAYCLIGDASQWCGTRLYGPLQVLDAVPSLSRRLRPTVTYDARSSAFHMVALIVALGADPFMLLCLECNRGGGTFRNALQQSNNVC